MEHDSTAYASSVEDCMRGTVAMIRNVGLSSPNAGARLVGQSMGAYMALELARAMLENSAAVASGTVFRRVPIGSPCTETGKCLCSFSLFTMTPYVLLRSVPRSR